MRKFVPTRMIYLSNILALTLLAFGSTKSADISLFLGILNSAALIYNEVRKFVERHPKIRVEHDPVSHSQSEYSPDYDSIVTTYLRGESPVSFEVAAFYAYHYDDDGAVNEAWEYHPIKHFTLSLQNSRSQIVFDPDTVGGYIIGCAMLDLTGKWHYSKNLKRKQRTANFKREPRKIFKPEPLDPNQEPLF